jgi:hypothetical protein
MLVVIIILLVVVVAELATIMLVLRYGLNDLIKAANYIINGGKNGTSGNYNDQDKEGR